MTIQSIGAPTGYQITSAVVKTGVDVTTRAINCSARLLNQIYKKSNGRERSATQEDPSEFEIVQKVADFTLSTGIYEVSREKMTLALKNLEEKKKNYVALVKQVQKGEEELAKLQKENENAAAIISQNLTETAKALNTNKLEKQLEETEALFRAQRTQISGNFFAIQTKQKVIDSLKSQLKAAKFAYEIAFEASKTEIEAQEKLIRLMQQELEGSKRIQHAFEEEVEEQSIST